MLGAAKRRGLICGSFSFEVTDGDTSLTINDVMAEEVWLCGEPSNMMWPVKKCVNSKGEIAAAKPPWLRRARTGLPAEPFRTDNWPGLIDGEDFRWLSSSGCTGFFAPSRCCFF